MKKYILALSFALVLSLLSKAQNSVESKCGTMDYLQKQKEADPELEQRMEIQEKQLQKWISENSKETLNKKSTIKIPVVVHILYSADSQNISNERVFAQISAINKSFSGQSTHSMGAFSSDMKVDTDIEFCLANIKPDGSATNGIERRETAVDGFTNNSVKFHSSGGLDAWDPQRYFNIWVCNYTYSDGTSYIFSAYAQFPGSGINNTYGIVIRYGAFGLDDTTYFRGSGGILSHEIGHCFNLRHIWGDDGTSCSGSDYCEDTPNQDARTSGKHSGLLTDNCSPSSPGIMYMNYMDYSDDVIYANFTPDQKTRMQANFAAPNGALLALSNSSACSGVSEISTIEKFEELRLFPNPANTQLNVQFAAKLTGAVYKIYDNKGNPVLIGNIAKQNTTIDLSELSVGIYLFSLGGNLKQTFVVIK
jgi:hypothetical protein